MLDLKVADMKASIMTDPKLIPFSEANPRCFTSLLCDGFVVRGIGSFIEWVNLLRQVQRDNPDHFLLASLDDLGQAGYTCGHTIMNHDLDNVEGYDLSQIDAVAFEDGEHIGHLTTSSEFFIRHANFLKLTEKTSIEAARGKAWWGHEQGDIASDNDQPDAALMMEQERDLIIQLVSVPRAADALAAFPNGYFSGDLQPHENYHLALWLEEQFEFRLFAVGASYLAFWRDEVLDSDTAARLAGDLAGFYGEVPSDGASKLAAIINGKDTLILRYSE